jgi:hypothetical protein
VSRICKIEEEQTTQWPKYTKEVIRICKIEEEQTTQPNSERSLLLLFNAACVTEKQQISISYGLTRLEPMIYRTLDKHANHYTKNIKGDYT